MVAQAEEYAALLHKSRDTVAAHVKLAGDFVAQGMLVKSELLRAEVELARMDDLVTEADGRVRIANANLAFRLGAAGDVVLGARDPARPAPHRGARSTTGSRRRPPAPTSGPPGSSSRPASSRRKVKKAPVWPKVALVAKGELYGDKPFGSTGTSGSIMAVATWNVFAGGSDHAAAVAAREEARAGREDVARFAEGVRLEVRQAFEEARTAQARHETAKKAVASAREAERITDERFRAGVVKTLDLLDVTTARREAETRELVARADAHTAALKLAVKAGRRPESVLNGGIGVKIGIWIRIRIFFEGVGRASRGGRARRGGPCGLRRLPASLLRNPLLLFPRLRGHGCRRARLAAGSPDPLRHRHRRPLRRRLVARDGERRRRARARRPVRRRGRRPRRDRPPDRPGPGSAGEGRPRAGARGALAGRAQLRTLQGPRRVGLGVRARARHDPDAVRAGEGRRPAGRGRRGSSLLRRPRVPRDGALRRPCGRPPRGGRRPRGTGPPARHGRVRDGPPPRRAGPRGHRRRVGPQDRAEAPRPDRRRRRRAHGLRRRDVPGRGSRQPHLRRDARARRARPSRPASRAARSSTAHPDPPSSCRRAPSSRAAA